MLLMTFSLGDLLMAADSLILLIQNLRFQIKIKKSYLEPTSTLESLRVLVDSVEMTLSLLKEKVLKVQNQSKKIPEKEQVTVRELRKLTDRLSPTVMVERKFDSGNDRSVISPLS